MKYWEQLRDPRWQEKRLEILNRANFKCEICDFKPTGEPLAIHHKYYEKGLMAWEYPNDALICACERCHEEAAENERGLLREIKPADYRNILPFTEELFYVNQAYTGLKEIAEALYRDRCPRKEEK